MLRILLFSILVGATSWANPPCHDYQYKASYKNEDEKFRDFLKKDWDLAMKQSPEWASDLGYKDLAGVWTDDSLKAIAYRKEIFACSEKAFQKINLQKLSKSNRVHYKLFQSRLELGKESLVFESHFMPLNQMDGVHTGIVDTLTGMPSSTAEDMENKLKRLKAASERVRQHQILLEAGLKRNMTPPQIVMLKIPSQFENILTEKPEDSALFLGFKDLKGFSPDQVKGFQSRAKEIILNDLYPELRNFKKFLSETYISGARKTLSVQDLPNGQQWYNWAIRYHTTTSMTAPQIHELGLSEVKRILSEMNQIREKVGFKKDLKKFNEYLRSDSKFYYTEAKDLMAGYREIAKRADAELPKLFQTLPRMSYGVREMEAFKAPSSPTAYYYQGSQENGRAGFFVANTWNLKARPKWGMEALTLHEAVPGHHLQIALSLELNDMPDFRKNGGYTAFTEGWGLYAESLGEEMGFYTDPYSKYGQLTYEMWRSVRLVVDTGLHSKSWTRDQAIDYFKQNTPMTLPDIEAEVDRYIVWPGQALAYKVGQIKIRELRTMAAETLKEKFNVRKFHDLVLGQGSVPLDLLESDVKAWVKAQQDSKTQLN